MEKCLLNGGKRSEFYKMGGKSGLGSAVILAETGMQGFVLIGSSWTEMKTPCL